MACVTYLIPTLSTFFLTIQLSQKISRYQVENLRMKIKDTKVRLCINFLEFKKGKISKQNLVWNFKKLVSQRCQIFGLLGIFRCNFMKWL